MKPLKRITILVAAVVAIITFWLAPGINTARDTRYTRRYEDTDKVYTQVADTARKTRSRLGKTSAHLQNKKYKTETLESTSKLSKIKATQFSRAIHFEEEKIIVDVDSAQEIELAVVVEVDTTRKIQ